MAQANKTSRRWLFTVYEDTEMETRELFSVMGVETGWGKEGVAQMERCPSTGRLHIQGYLITKDPRRMAWMKNNVHNTAHWEAARGSHEQCYDYCTKELTRVEGYLPKHWGGMERDKAQGKRNDMNDAIQLAKEAAAAGGQIQDIVKAVAREAPGAYVRYHAGFQALAEELVEDDTEDEEEMAWHPWQAALITELGLRPDKRTIYWFEDTVGGAGKSTIVNKFTREGKGILLEGKVADMKYAYMNNKKQVVFFDISRTMAENMNHLYQFAEQLKNGQFMNTKFKSKEVTFKRPHVVFFSNGPPDLTKFTADRWRYYKIEGTIAFPQDIPGMHHFHAMAQEMNVPAAAAAGGAAAGGAGAPIDLTQELNNAVGEIYSLFD